MRKMNVKVIFAGIFFSCLILYSCSENSTEPEEISLTQAENIVLTELLNGSDSGKVVYELPTKMNAGTIVNCLDSMYTAPEESWFFFIDDAPHQRWVHPCRYVFIFCTSGEYTVHNERLPPENNDSLRVVNF